MTRLTEFESDEYYLYALHPGPVVEEEIQLHKEDRKFIFFVWEGRHVYVWGAIPPDLRSP